MPDCRNGKKKKDIYQKNDKAGSIQHTPKHVTKVHNFSKQQNHDKIHPGP